MRTLLLLRGIQASGKSTWIKENNLEPYTLSAEMCIRDRSWGVDVISGGNHSWDKKEIYEYCLLYTSV